ncbi:MAG: SpoIID/LytB domain-containing protein [Nitrospirae bacterium]|nr:MAG: SpoIID/LytB domain-containing protein [Nitrospirota bacterium]
MTRARTTAALALLFVVLSASVLAPAQAQAGETIRMALFQNVESVTVASSSGLIVRAPNDTVDSSGRITVAAGPSGLIVDGQPLRSDRLDVRGRDGELTINGLTVGNRVIVKRQNGKLLAINELPLEDYVKGVVPSEMNPAWHLEALKVQAIATRTYALYKMRQNARKDFDVVASVKDQVYLYRGRAAAAGPAARATAETRDQVLAYRDEPILAAFSSTAAGLTEDAWNVWSVDLPYLKGVECPFDLNSPWYQWRTDVGLAMLEQRLRDEGFPVGVIASLAPATFTKAGRVAEVRILHSGGELYVKGDDLRRVLGYTVLPSTQFDFDVVGLQVQFAGRGNGHGVGLCQWGAKELAERGYSAETILRYYYPGTDIRDLDSLPRR